MSNLDPNRLLTLASHDREALLPYFLVDQSHRLVEVDDILDCVRWLQEHRDADVVGRDEFRCQDETVVVSTIFLTYELTRLPDQRYAVYETAVFGGRLDGTQQRYASWHDAEVGHQRLVEQVRRAIQEQLHHVH